MSDVPEPSSTSVSALVTAAISLRALDEDRPLAPSRVVLGEARDVVEELRAARVVEPLRRDVFRRRAQAALRVGTERVPEVVGGEVDVDARRGRSVVGHWGVPRFGLRVRREAYAPEQPPAAGREEIAIGDANVRKRGDARATAQHHLAAHELAVVLTDCARCRLRSVDRGGRRWPSIATRHRTPARARAFPDAGAGCKRARPGAVSARPRIRRAKRLDRVLPLEFGREPRARPARRTRRPRSG